MGKTNNRTRNPEREAEGDVVREEFGLRSRRLRKRGGARNFTRDIMDNVENLDEDEDVV